MKKRLVILQLSLVLVLSSFIGCASASAWWSDFKSNPVAQVTTFEQSVQVIMSDAQMAFQTVLPFLPTAVQAKAAQVFNDAVVTVNHALQVLNDAVQAAADVQQTAPDFSGAIKAVSDAVNQVIAIIDQYKTQQVQPAGVAPGTVAKPLGEPVGLPDAKAGAATLKRWGGK